MALNFTPEQLALYDERVTDTPGSVVVPDAIDIANGDADADDILVTSPSGIQQDINGAVKGIEDTDTRIAETIIEISMQAEFVNHYHNFLRGYENERKYNTGESEAVPWILADSTEANNIYKNVSTRYFPLGQLTSPLKINEYDEELGNGPRVFDIGSFVTGIAHMRNQINTFRGNWSNSIRSNNDTNDGAMPPFLQPTYDAELAALHVQLNTVVAGITNYEALLNAPWFDDQHPGSEVSAAARLLEVVPDKVWMQDVADLVFFVDYVPQDLEIFFPFAPIPGTGAGLEIEALYNNEAAIGVRATARADFIELTYMLSSYYGLRREFAIELADFGEGVIYKKLQDIDSRVDQVDRLAKLQRKLDVYVAAGL